mgnify:CR=1 FL=1
MTSALRSVSQFALLSIEQQTYAEYVDTLPDPSYLAVFSLEPVPQPGVLAQDPGPVQGGDADGLLDREAEGAPEPGEHGQVTRGTF